MVVDLLDANGQFYPDITDVNGMYSFEGVRYSNMPDAAEVSISIPLGFTAVSPGADGAALTLDQNQLMDFSLACLEATGDAVGMGYWKHQANVYINNRGHAHETEENMTTNYPLAIFSHFHENELNSIAVEGVTFMDSGGVAVVIDLATIQSTLTVNRNGSKRDRAKQRYLGFLLNIASGKLQMYTVVSEDGMTTSQALQHVAVLINHPNSTDDDYLLAKQIASTVNSAGLVAAGVIDPDIEHISYAKPRGEANLLPSKTSFAGVWPSLIKSSATVHFQLSETAPVSVRVYNPAGRLVRELLNEVRSQGFHSVDWDGRNDSGRSTSQGVYYVRFETKDYQETKRAVVLR